MTIKSRRAWGRIDASFLKSRGAALVLTIIVHLLMLLALLLSRAPHLVRKKEDDGLVTFSVMPMAEKKDAGEKTKTKSLLADKAAPSPTPKPDQPPPPAVAPRPKDNTPSFIQMSPGDFAAADIGRLPSRGAANGTGGSTGNSSAVAGPGQGPGGVQMYRAEWYREPSHAELDPYMPERYRASDEPMSGEAYIACKTIEHYHVENCQTLWETPGSGLGRALREASWQFLIRPQRLNGKPLIGSLVEIHFTMDIVKD